MVVASVAGEYTTCQGDNCPVICAGSVNLTGEFGGTFNKTDQEANGRAVWKFGKQCIWWATFDHWWTGSCNNLGENTGGPWLENRTMCPYGPAFDANNQVWRRAGSDEILPLMKAYRVGEDPLTVRESSNNPSEVECSYSDWSSCSYYCGETKVETRYQTLVDDTKESRAMCPLRQEEECGTIACTGESTSRATTTTGLDPLLTLFICLVLVCCRGCNNSCTLQGNNNQSL